MALCTIVLANNLCGIARVYYPAFKWHHLFGKKSNIYNLFHCQQLSHLEVTDLFDFKTMRIERLHKKALKYLKF